MKKVIILLAIFTNLLFANIGTVTLAEGEVFAKRAGQTFALKLADIIEKNDFIETKVNSKIKITFNDNTIITIGKESTLDISEYIFDGKNSETELGVTKGAFHIITGEIGKANPSKFKLKTKNATIGIRGTEIYGDQSTIFCTQGAIFIESFGEIREVSSGFYVNTFENQQPGEATAFDQDEFNKIDSKLNVNQAGIIGTQEDFGNPSTPLSLENPTSGDIDDGLNADSQNSWGYWASSVQDDHNSANTSNHLDNETANLDNNLNQITDPSYVQGLMNNSGTEILTFKGSITPNSDIGTISDNYINFEFEFGGNTNEFFVEYSLISTNFESFGEFTGIADANGFYVPPMQGSSNILNGKYYGPTINSVAGDINMIDRSGSYSIDGTFNATR